MFREMGIIYIKAEAIDRTILSTVIGYGLLTG